MRFVSYHDRKKIAVSMRTIYATPSLEAAEIAFKDLDTEWGRQYPGVVDVWRRAWNEFIPFLDYPVELRRVVYTTNAIESINFQLWKVTKTRGNFPSSEATMKLICLALRNISSKREGESETGKPIKDFVILVENHWDGVIVWQANHLSNGLLDGINSLV
jgi:putative transposase